MYTIQLNIMTDSFSGIALLIIYTLLAIHRVSNGLRDSVNRLGDLLDFGQLFEAFGSN